MPAASRACFAERAEKRVLASGHVLARPPTDDCARVPDGRADGCTRSLWWRGRIGSRRAREHQQQPRQRSQRRTHGERGDRPAGSGPIDGHARRFRQQRFRRDHRKLYLEPDGGAAGRTQRSERGQTDFHVPARGYGDGADLSARRGGQPRGDGERHGQCERRGQRRCRGTHRFRARSLQQRDQRSQLCGYDGCARAQRGGRSDQHSRSLDDSGKRDDG